MQQRVEGWSKINYIGSLSRLIGPSFTDDFVRLKQQWMIFLESDGTETDNQLISAEIKIIEDRLIERLSLLD